MPGSYMHIRKQKNVKSNDEKGGYKQKKHES